ncbi:Trk system potassium uptake protein (HKT1) [Leptomonas pyrrhocoris]|uniref:Trk system potassium uptake protein (HKT1) n=1 Tax=Leptomonas pyrrhocoris TaxID=157538 RepID=A0A0M9GA39_LEPPY|nr:Trk system potassium uptake protein (HKT1) [Leptomonas pyrrhocoris]KPA85849.1 Trk system potassium uptake protein (HKT1) [Leptomonas pyrrhocoris]|eukprot:XP_015664288.1 Trk system potassium uptake protein (HKT1) [Leptomonas pyrrhocoris]
MPPLMSPFEGTGSQRQPNPTQPHDEQRSLASRSSQLLFEAPVMLSLSPDQSQRILMLEFFKRWYFLCHFVYICVCVSIGAVGLLLLEADISVVDAVFIATSSVCNCGLQTVDVGAWRTSTTLFRHLLLLTGGVVVTSSFQPLLRLFMLHRMRDVFLPEVEDTPLEAQLRAKKREEAHRLYYTALISAVTPFAYLVVVNGVIMALLFCFNTSHLSGLQVFCMTLASFHSSIFLPMEAYANDVAVAGLVAVACALGFTAFPVVLRGFMWTEWTAVRFVRRVAKPIARCVELCRKRPGRTTEVDDNGAEGTSEVEDDAMNVGLLRTGQQHHHNSNDTPHAPFLVQLRDVDVAFQEVLRSTEPGAFHPFLFQPGETGYLGAAWWALTLAQAFPYWYEQWDGVLHPYPWPYKIYISLCQAAVVRFAAASFLPLLDCSNAHVAVTILAMFLPALPISTDRTYRKWKEMFRTSIVRLLTSRLFWIFMAMVLVLFVEEQDMRASIMNTRFDMLTRTLFEVVSAYAGCGLSLTLAGATVSFVGLTSTFSKLIIAAVILGGRHRFVDLGIDLGFSTLGSQVRAVAEPRLPPASPFEAH